MRVETASVLSEQWKGSLVGSPIPSIVDFGCGDGELTEELIRRLPWAGEALLSLVELDTELRLSAQTRLKPLVASVEHDSTLDGPNLPSPYSHVLASHVLYYASDPDGWFDELLSFLRPNALVSIVIRSAECDTWRMREIVRRSLKLKSRISVASVSESLQVRGFSMESSKSASARFTMPISSTAIDRFGKFNDSDEDESLDTFVRWMVRLPVTGSIADDLASQLRTFLRNRHDGEALNLDLADDIITGLRDSPSVR